MSRHHRAACPRAHSLSPFSPPWWTLLGVRHNNTPRPAPPRLLGASSRQHQTVPHRDSPVLHEALGVPWVGTSIQNRPETPRPPPSSIPCTHLWTYRGTHTCFPSLLRHTPHRAPALLETGKVITSKGKEKFGKASSRGLLVISSKGPHTSV